MKHIVFILAFLVLAGTSFAQAPQKLNYQGIARNNSGQPLAAAALGLRITIRDLTATGTVLYQESHSATTNSYGLYNVAIGAGTAITGTFPGIVWATGDKYIQIEIDPAGGTSYSDAGTTQLLSVPYALYAGNAANATLADSAVKSSTSVYTDSSRAAGSSAKIVLPYADAGSDAGSLFKITNNGDGASLEGISGSLVGNAAAIKGTISSTSPGGFSSAVRGQNNGTGGLGIGVYGSQGGSGWGVYGTTPGGIGVHGNSTSGFGLYGLSSSGTGVYGNSTTGNAGSFSITNNASTANAMEVNTTGTGKGINVTAVSAAGIQSTSTSGMGLHGVSSSSYGVYALSNTSSGLYATSTNGNAGTVSITNAANSSNALEVNTSGTGKAVNVSSTSGIAVQSTSNTGQAGNFYNSGASNATTALAALTIGTGSALSATITNATNAAAAFTASTTGTGRAGSLSISNTSNTSTIANLSSNGTGNGLSIQLTNSGNGARGIEVTHSGVGPGVFATTAGNAIWGITTNVSSAAVIGDNTPGECVVGRGNSSLGSGVGAVVGRQDGAGCYGVRGFVTGAGAIGVLGQAGISGSVNYAGRFENVNASNTSDVVQVSSNAANANGIYVTVPAGSATKAGVHSLVSGSSAIAIIGESNSGGSATGIWGKSTSGWAGYFSGNVHVAGTLSKSAGSFKIDHPADPANKYLIHSFVESPDMMNVYNGNATTDASGTAIVDLPSYFEIENIDFKYQLTVIGQFAQAIISKEVSGNKFEIKTDKPNVKVSWQVTGVRNDKFAQQHRIVPEVEKAPDEKGYYLDPSVYGQPETKGMPYSRMKGQPIEQPKMLELTGAEKNIKLPSNQPREKQ